MSSSESWAFPGVFTRLELPRAQPGVSGSDARISSSGSFRCQEAAALFEAPSGCLCFSSPAIVVCKFISSHPSGRQRSVFFSFFSTKLKFSNIVCKYMCIKKTAYFSNCQNTYDRADVWSSSVTVLTIFLHERAWNNNPKRILKAAGCTFTHVTAGSSVEPQRGILSYRPDLLCCLLAAAAACLLLSQCWNIRADFASLHLSHVLPLASWWFDFVVSEARMSKLVSWARLKVFLWL